MSEVIEGFLQYGALGLMCLVLLAWIYRQDAAHRVEVDVLRTDLKQEQEGRITDAKAFTQVALDLQARVISAVEDIRGIVEEYGSLGTTVGELTKVLRRRNGRDRDYP